MSVLYLFAYLHTCLLLSVHAKLDTDFDNYNYNFKINLRENDRKFADESSVRCGSRWSLSICGAKKLDRWFVRSLDEFQSHCSSVVVKGILCKSIHLLNSAKELRRREIGMEGQQTRCLILEVDVARETDFHQVAFLEEDLVRRGSLGQLVLKEGLYALRSDLTLTALHVEVIKVRRILSDKDGDQSVFQ